MPLTMQEPPRPGAAMAMNDAEWQARVQLASCYRVFDRLGWTEGIFNHITLRVPGPERIFLINPFGLNYDEVTASKLVATSSWLVANSASLPSLSSTSKAALRWLL